MGLVDVDAHVSSHLKENLTWAADIHMASGYLLFKSSYSTKELKEQPF